VQIINIITYLGSFEINYIAFKNAEIFRKYFSQKEKIVKESEKVFEIFWNILLKMES
jgi:hypothetical protein